VREGLGELRATMEETTLADRRLKTLSAEAEELLRLGPTDEKGMAEYKHDLARSVVESTTVKPEEVAARREKLLGRSTEPEKFPLADDEAEWRRQGLIVDPEEDERRMKWGRDAQKAKRAEAADRAEGLLG
jgi:hypothetical protein